MSDGWFSSLIYRFRALQRWFLPGSPAAQNTESNLDEELQFHLDQSTQANVAAGMPLKAARRQALLDFGGIAQSREETYRQRPGWFIETLLQDARYALRGFRRNPVFTITIIATLSLAIGATTAVFSVVDPILFRALPYVHDDRLVSLGLVQSLEKQEFTLGGFFYEWRDNQKPFESLTFEQGVSECNLTEANPLPLHCAKVAETFLPTLGIYPVAGRNFLPEEDLPNGPKVALISNGFWLSRYNRDPGVLNKTLNIDGHPVRIVGVLPENFEMPRLQSADILLPAAMDVSAQHTVNSGIGYPMWAFARLKPGVSIQQAHAEMDPLFKHTQQWIPAEFRKEFRLQIRSIRDRQMQEAYTVAWALLAAVFAVLVIACANVASLFSARGASRERELAVRSALGASKVRLVRQTLVESLLLALAGACLGCALAEVLLRIFIAIAPNSVPFLAKAQLDLRIVLFAVLVAILSSLLFGIVPALEKPRTTALAARSTESGSHARLRRILVVAQIAFSVVLLSSATLLLKSFWNLEHESLGMQTGEVLTAHFSLSPEHYATGQAYMNFYLRAEEALRRIPGITAVGISDSLPPDSNSWHDGVRYADIVIAGKPHPSQSTTATVVTRKVTPGYFSILHIPILQGRGFTEEDRTETGNAMILSSLLAARLFPDGNAIGSRIQIASYLPYYSLNVPVFTVIGVAANVKNAGLAGQDDAEYYTLRSSKPENWSGHAVILLKTVLPASVAGPWVRSQIAQIDPIAPVEIESLTQTVNQLADRPRFEVALIGFFASCGLLMAVIGLYGLTSYIARRRTQEIGIRMALGADRSDILRLIAWEGMRVIALGGLLGMAAALAVAQLIRNLLFSVAPHDPAAFAAVALLLAIVALVATLIPARAATRVDPVVALRYE